MRVFKSKRFSKFAQKEDISDAKLYEVIMDIEKGKIDVDYGGGVIKQRVARLNEGKSGGYRVIVLYKQKDRSFFIHGFSKKEKDNLSKFEEDLYKKAAKIAFSLSKDTLDNYVKNGFYKEVTYDS